MKKLVLKLDLHDDKDKSKALKMVTTVAGVDSISMDMKGKKLTVIGTVDPVKLVSKLRKSWAADFILVGPAKEPEKKEEPKKEEPKKEEPKKEEPKKEPKKEEPKKEEEAKKEEPKKEEEKELAPVVGIMPYRAYYYASLPSTYYPPLSTYRYANHSMEENPSACVTCWLCARANHSMEEPDMGPAEGPNTIGFRKLVLKLDLHDDEDKSKALKMVTTLAGIDSISMDMKGKKLTVVGTVDPVKLVGKLRKFWAADIILVGLAKEPEKKEEPKKEEPKKEEPKKEEPKKEEEKKELAPVVGIMPDSSYYYPPLSPYRFANHSMEEIRSACVIC